MKATEFEWKWAKNSKMLGKNSNKNNNLNMFTVQIVAQFTKHAIQYNCERRFRSVNIVCYIYSIIRTNHILYEMKNDFCNVLCMT